MLQPLRLTMPKPPPTEPKWKRIEWPDGIRRRGRITGWRCGGQVYETREQAERHRGMNDTLEAVWEWDDADLDA